jgi:hypothetical protein
MLLLAFVQKVDAMVLLLTISTGELQACWRLPSTPLIGVLPICWLVRVSRSHPGLTLVLG